MKIYFEGNPRSNSNYRAHMPIFVLEYLSLLTVGIISVEIFPKAVINTPNSVTLTQTTHILGNFSFKCVKRINKPL